MWLVLPIIIGSRQFRVIQSVWKVLYTHPAFFSSAIGWAYVLLVSTSVTAPRMGAHLLRNGSWVTGGDIWFLICTRRFPKWIHPQQRRRTYSILQLEYLVSANGRLFFYRETLCWGPYTNYVICFSTDFATTTRPLRKKKFIEILIKMYRKKMLNLPSAMNPYVISAWSLILDNSEHQMFVGKVSGYTDFWLDSDIFRWILRFCPMTYNIDGEMKFASLTLMVSSTIDNKNDWCLMCSDWNDDVSGLNSNLTWS